MVSVTQWPDSGAEKPSHPDFLPYAKVAGLMDTGQMEQGLEDKGPLGLFTQPP
jgi:hypothetical protein